MSGQGCPWALRERTVMSFKTGLIVCMMTIVVSIWVLPVVNRSIESRQRAAEYEAERYESLGDSERRSHPDTALSNDDWHKAVNRKRAELGLPPKP